MDNVSTDVQITVTKVIKPTGRGILVLGHVDSGLVHPRDLFQVHNHQLGATARAGRIYQGRKRIQEASAGNDIKLLLERIDEAEIHPGDQLLPGEKKDLRPAPKKALCPIDDELWKKLPERIEPILHLRQFSGRIVNLIVLSLFWFVPIGFILSSPSMSTILFFIIWYAFLSYITYEPLKWLINGFRGRSRFLQGQSQTIAQILRRKDQLHEGDYNDWYTYHLQLEFTPTMVNISTCNLKLQAQIGKKLYESLKKNEMVNIIYAVDDPRIFLIEGE